MSRLGGLRYSRFGNLRHERWGERVCGLGFVDVASSPCGFAFGHRFAAGGFSLGFGLGDGFGVRGSLLGCGFDEGVAAGEFGRGTGIELLESADHFLCFLICPGTFIAEVTS